MFISPCPNDTFVHHAWVHHLVDVHGLAMEVNFEDIDLLNQRALNNKTDVIKVSTGVLPLIKEDYNMMRCGGAMGYGNGPLLVTKHNNPLVKRCPLVAIAGENTTAAMLLRQFFPEVTTKVYLFSDIARAVKSGEVDAGVLIHEGRFTYAAQGLELVADLGQLWQNKTQLPIPLGVMVVKKTVPLEIQQKIEHIVSASCAFAMASPSLSSDWVRSHARELSPEVLQQHISYFVNDFTLDMGADGLSAIERLLGEQIPTVPQR